MTQISELLGQRVREERKARGMTLAALAEQAGLSARFVGEVERGRANPSLGSLADLSEALGVSLLSLLVVCGPEKARLLSAIDVMGEAEARRAFDASGQVVARPLVLLGLRGAGKSTLGQMVAKETGRPFVEVNQRIEAEAGMSLGAIFELHGEAYYRDLERNVIAGVLSVDNPPPVVEVSGGVVTHEASWRLLLRGALTVWLRATPQEHWDRVVAQGDQRPMGGRERARLELEELYARRAPRYSEAERTVTTTERSAAEVAAELVDLVQTVG